MINLPLSEMIDLLSVCCDKHTDEGACRDLRHRKLRRRRGKKGCCVLAPKRKGDAPRNCPSSRPDLTERARGAAIEGPSRLLLRSAIIGSPYTFEPAFPVMTPSDNTHKNFWHSGEVPLAVICVPFAAYA